MDELVGELVRKGTVVDEGVQLDLLPPQEEVVLQQHRWNAEEVLQLVARQQRMPVVCPDHLVPYYVMSTGMVCLVGDCERRWP
jgi:hypothetical protein